MTKWKKKKSTKKLYTSCSCMAYARLESFHNSQRKTTFLWSASFPAMSSVTWFCSQKFNQWWHLHLPSVQRKMLLSKHHWFILSAPGQITRPDHALGGREKPVAKRWCYDNQFPEWMYTISQYKTQKILRAVYYHSILMTCDLHSAPYPEKHLQERATMLWEF